MRNKARIVASICSFHWQDVLSLRTTVVSRTRSMRRFFFIEEEAKEDMIFFIDYNKEDEKNLHSSRCSIFKKDSLVFIFFYKICILPCSHYMCTSMCVRKSLVISLLSLLLYLLFLILHSLILCIRFFLFVI
jgi:hypothetical protein